MVVVDPAFAVDFGDDRYAPGNGGSGFEDTGYS